MTRPSIQPDPSGATPPRQPRPFFSSIAFRAGVAVIVGALALAAFAVAGLLALFRAGNPALSGRIVAELNRAVTSDSTRFTCDRVHGTLFRGVILDNPKLLVLTPVGEVVWAQSRSLRVDADLIALAFGQKQDLRVELDQPRIDLVHDRRGELVMPRFVQGKKGEKRSGETRVVIAVKDGAFSMDRAKTRYGRIGGTATLVLGPERSTILLDRLSGTNLTPGRPRKLELSGELDVEHGALRARPLEVTLGSSRLTAEVDWDLEKARVRDGTLSVHPLELQEFFRAFDLASADGTANGEITFSGTPTDGSARVCLQGTYAGEPVDTLVLAARSRPGAVDFSALHLRVRKNDVTGSGAFDTRAGALIADLAFRDVNPAVLPWWKSPENTPSGSLAGRGRFSVRRAPPSIDVAASVDLASSRLGRLAIRRGHLRVAAHPNGAAVLDSSWVDVPGGRIVAVGSLGADRALLVNVHASVHDLSGMNELLGSPQIDAGRGRVDGTLSGTLESPLYKAQMDLYGTRLKNGVGGDSVTVELQGRFRPELDLVADAGIRGLHAGERALGNVDATVSGGKTLRIERYRQSLGDTLITLAGKVIFAEEGTEAQIDSVALAAGEYHIRNRGPVRIGFFGKRVRMSDLALDLDPGTLRLDLDYNPSADAIDARGSIAEVDLGRLPGLSQGKTRFAGVLQGDFLASGPLRDPDVSLKLAVIEPVVGDIAGDSVRLDLNYTPGVLTVEQAAWKAAASRILASGTIRPHLTLQDWLRAAGRHDRTWTEHADLALTASLDSFDLRLVAPADTSLRTLEGIATGNARVSGTSSAPVMSIEGRVSSMSYRGVSGEIAAVDLAYKDRRLRINRFEARQTEGSGSQIRGELPLDLAFYADDRLIDKEPISLTVEIPNGDFSIARLLLPEMIGYSSGRYSASAVVSGTPADARVTGNFHLTGGRLRPAGRDEVIDHVDLDATFDQKQLTITRAVAKQGEKGKIEATGFWRWPTGKRAAGPPGFGPPGTYEMHVKATDFTATDRNTYAARFTGSLDIVNGRDPRGAERPLITGHGTITKGELTLDLAKPPSAPSEPLPFLYSVTVDMPGNFFYRNLDAEVEVETVEGPLTFKNEGDGDLALGVLEVRSGKYYVVTREFRNLQGTISFNNPDRIDPDVNIVGETSIPAPGTQEGSRVVYLALTDRVSRLKVRVYDDNGTPPNDLWKALAFGQFVPLGGVGTTEAAASGGVDPSVAVPISNYLFQNVERWIGSSGFIDTIDLRGSGAAADQNKSTSALSVVGVGKYVTPQFYFKYSKDFSATAEQEISADYRVTRHLLLKGQQIRSTAPDKPPQEYNLDLKIRLEY
jgi:autotransporter translocation and assembly factor TamB